MQIRSAIAVIIAASILTPAWADEAQTKEIEALRAKVRQLEGEIVLLKSRLRVAQRTIDELTKTAEAPAKGSDATREDGSQKVLGHDATAAYLLGLVPNKLIPPKGAGFPNAYREAIAEHISKQFKDEPITLTAQFRSARRKGDTVEAHYGNGQADNRHKFKAKVGRLTMGELDITTRISGASISDYLYKPDQLIEITGSPKYVAVWGNDNDKGHVSLTIRLVFEKAEINAR